MRMLQNRLVHCQVWENRVGNLVEFHILIHQRHRFGKFPQEFATNDSGCCKFQIFEPTLPASYHYEHRLQYDYQSIGQIHKLH